MDNIVPKPDLALELGKSISLTEAEEEAVVRENSCSNAEFKEEAVAREVHATHARIVSGPRLKPMQRKRPGTGSTLKITYDQEKSKVIEELDSPLPVPSISPATTITTSFPEITPFITLQLRVARLEQEMSEVKKNDHSAMFWPSIKSPKSHQESRIRKKSSKGDYLNQKGTGEEKQDSIYSHQLDEDAMDKEVQIKSWFKDTRSKADSDDEEVDDVMKALRWIKPGLGHQRERSPGSAAYRSAQAPLKDDQPKVQRKPHESSDSSKKLKGIQTLTLAEQEAADIMKALKESKKMSKRQPGTGGSNKGTGNILGVPDESTVIF
ncbi:hypothetical protein Tco_1079255 [Tanacetum coccineum]|uniref:Uncharacterized protein n=1 Tax=Tanacetum coccineum TaxID=301880 RepID=A0ABQ5HRS6_9ASTR